MPLLTPTKTLPGVNTRQFYPTQVAAQPPPDQGECLIGPIRTVVPLAQGVLGGFTPGVLPPTLGNARPSTTVQVTWENTKTFSVEFAGVTYSGTMVGAADTQFTVKYATAAPLAANTQGGAGTTLTGNVFGAIVVDGVTPLVADLILVKNEVSSQNNGVYAVTVVGDGGTDFVLTRVAGMDTYAETVAAEVMVTLGNTLANTTWLSTNTGAGVIGTDPVTFQLDVLTNAATAYDVLSGFATAVSADPFASLLVKDFIITNPTATPTISSILVLFSDYAIDNGFFAPLVVGGTAAYSPSTPIITKPVLVSIPFPTLKSNWLKINSKQVIPETLFGIDKDPERFYYDMTSNSTTALTTLISEAGSDPSSVSYAYDSVYVGTSGTQTITISQPPMPGTQRVVARCIQTGIEYELRHQSDKNQAGGGSAGAADFEYTVTTTSGSTGPADGGFAVTDVVHLAFGASNLFDFSGGKTYIVRAVYIPIRYAAPLPGYVFKSLVPNLSDVSTYAPLNKFTIDEDASRVNISPFFNTSSASRISYTKSVQITALATGDTSNRYIDINLAPDFTKTLSIAANVYGLSSTIDLNAPNIGSLVVKTHGGATLTNGVDYTFDAAAGTMSPISATAVAPFNNPLSVAVVYSPYATFAGAPTVKWNGLTTAPTGWPGGQGAFPPAIVSIGGGRYRVFRGITSAGTPTPLGVYAIAATIEYPVSPEVRMEFIAERGDIDGYFNSYSSLADIQTDTNFIDTYNSVSISPDVTTANPTLHAAKLALTVTAGKPIFIGIGEMTADRSGKILSRLERETAPYDLVAISQDSESILSYVGAHVDKIVSTLAGTQIHINRGSFRILYVTLDQRSEAQIAPEILDTVGGNGRICVGTSGGVAIITTTASLSGNLDSIAPGDFVESYQADVAPAAAIVGNATYQRAKPRRLKIDSIDRTISGYIKFNVSDPSLPATIDFANAFQLLRAAPMRIVRLRSGAEVATDIAGVAIGITQSPNGFRRNIRQPDFIEVDDGGTNIFVPGFYRSVLEAAFRSSNLPHQGMSRITIPLIVGVRRNLGYYESDDAIATMVSYGIDYAIQPKTGGPVFTIQQLTADRDNMFTQAPTVIRVDDFFAASLAQSLDPYIGGYNVTDENIDSLAAVAQAVIELCKNIRTDKLGGMITSGEITSIEALPFTSANAGVRIKYKIRPALAIEEIDNDIYIDTTPPGQR